MYTTHPQTLTTTSTQLSLAGNCGYKIQNDRVVLNIDEIASHRESGDISGTLSLELWALKQPYQGGEFSGSVLAGTQIGELYGEHYLSNCRYDLILQEPSAGNWYLTLMLREWTSMGFVTRDHVNFALPYIVANKPTVVRSDSDNVINISFSGNEKPANKEASVQTPKVEAKATEPSPSKPQTPKVEAKATQPSPSKPQAPKVEAKATQPSPGKPQTSRVKENKATQQPDQTPRAKQTAPQMTREQAPAVPAATERAASKTSDRISLNQASRKEIAAIKGVSKKLADNIVSARPFKTLDDLLSVQGMGPKLLSKLSDSIKL